MNKLLGNRFAVSVNLSVAWLLVAFAGSAYGSDTYFSGFAQLSGEGSDNFSLRTSNENEVYTGRFTLGLGLTDESELRSYSVDAIGAFRRYTGENEGLDDFPSLTLSSDYSERLSETLSYSGTASYRLDRTSTDEFEELGGAGFFLDRLDIDVKRDTWRSGLSSEYRMSPKNSWVNSLNGTLVRYEDAEQTSLIDYDFVDLSSQYVHAASSSTSLFVATSLSIFHQRPEDETVQQLTSVDSNSVSVLFGARHKISEKDHLDFNLGVRRTRFDPVIEPRNYDTGTQASIEYRRLLETGSFAFSYGKSLQPSSDGDIVDSDQSSVSYVQNFSDRARLVTTLSYQREETQGRSNTEEDEEFTELRIAARHKISNEQSVSFTYRHARDLSGEDDAKRNSFNLAWRWAISRMDW